MNRDIYISDYSIVNTKGFHIHRTNKPYKKSLAVIKQNINNAYLMNPFI